MGDALRLVLGDPWVSGNVNTMQGRVDLSFRVTGDKRTYRLLDDGIRLTLQKQGLFTSPRSGRHKVTHGGSASCHSDVGITILTCSPIQAHYRFWRDDPVGKQYRQGLDAHSTIGILIHGTAAASVDLE